MSEYVVKTPNPEYKGRAYGVRFNNGTAIIVAETLDPNVGLSADQIARRMLELGYTVTRRGSDAPLTAADLPTDARWHVYGALPRGCDRFAAPLTEHQRRTLAAHDRRAIASTQAPKVTAAGKPSRRGRK